MPEARIIGALSDIPARDWDALHDGRNPFATHAFLSGLEQHGCLRPHYGWSPHHLTLWADDRLVAAAPAYRKSNSHGEFVFDHAWAHAYAQHDRDYFPKWLVAVPYSPVTGPRLLSRHAAGRRALLDALEQGTRRAGWSSAHVNFHGEEDGAAFGDAWIPRIDVQYHWKNPGHWRDFDDFLGALDHKHRKNIRQERERVRRAGISHRIVHGGEATDADIARMHGFYLRTFREYGNTPALTLEFFDHLARSLPRNLVLFIAERAGDPIAGALCLRGGDTLYGRYWGTHERVPGLHFETCYFQGIEYCLREGLGVFEPGAQGEHKLARGFLPQVVRSRHWIADPAFAAAIAHWCREETVAIDRYAATLAARSPFRTTQ
jgi:hypothetical protein